MKRTIIPYEKPDCLIFTMGTGFEILEASYGKDGEAGSEIDFDNEYDL